MINAWLFMEGMNDLECVQAILKEFCGSVFLEEKTDHYEVIDAKKTFRIAVWLYSGMGNSLKYRWKQRFPEFKERNFLYRILKDTDDRDCYLRPNYILDYQHKIGQQWNSDSQYIIPVQPEIEAWFLASVVNSIRLEKAVSISESEMENIRKLSAGYTTTEHVIKEDLGDKNRQAYFKRLALNYGIWQESDEINPTIRLFLDFINRLFDTIRVYQ